MDINAAAGAIGYADGWPRAMSTRGFGFVDGYSVPQVGNISMDSVTFDVTALGPDQVAAGRLIDLICPEHPVDAVAVLAGTIGDDVLTNLGPRVHRQYVGQASAPSPEGQA